MTTALSTSWYNPIFLRELSRRLSWGQDPAHDRKLFAEVAKVSGEPKEKIMDAMIDWKIRQLLPYHHAGNDTQH